MKNLSSSALRLADVHQSPPFSEISENFLDKKKSTW